MWEKGRTKFISDTLPESPVVVQDEVGPPVPWLIRHLKATNKQTCRTKLMSS
jgi:hypothetical protein